MNSAMIVLQEVGQVQVLLRFKTQGVQSSTVSRRPLQTAPCGPARLGTSGRLGPGRLGPQGRLRAAPEVDRHALQRGEGTLSPIASQHAVASYDQPLHTGCDMTDTGDWDHWGRPWQAVGSHGVLRCDGAEGALSTLQGVTVDFRSDPQPPLWPQAARPQPPRCTEPSWVAWCGLKRPP